MCWTICFTWVAEIETSESFINRKTVRKTRGTRTFLFFLFAEVDRPVDHCEEGTHTCDVSERAQCIYTGGSSYICSCLQGFVGDGRTCQGTKRETKLIVAASLCMLNGRGLQNLKYLSLKSKHSHVLPSDIDECQPGRCHQNAVCINTQGSFLCQCQPGYSGNGIYCSSGDLSNQMMCFCRFKRFSLR